MAKNVSATISIEEIHVKNNESLEDLVVKDVEKIENGLSIIGRQIPITHDKIVDLLCADRNGQIAVLKLNVSENDNMFFEGLTTFHEVNAVKQMLKYFNKNSNINDKELPRLILIAPSFSNNIRNIAKNMNNVKINLYSWEYLKFGDKKSLRFKPVSIT